MLDFIMYTLSAEKHWVPFVVRMYSWECGHPVGGLSLPEATLPRLGSLILIMHSLWVHYF